MSKTPKMTTYKFNVGGTVYEVSAMSKFAAKKKLKRNPDLPDYPIVLVREGEGEGEEDEGKEEAA